MTEGTLYTALWMTLLAVIVTWGKDQYIRETAWGILLLVVFISGIARACTS